ncbi:MAG: FlgD immunoglobulin-like domain containing protein [bacterium]
MDKTRLLYSVLFGLLFPLFFSSVGFRNSHVAELTDNSGTLHKDGQMSWGGQSRLYYYYEPENPGPSPRPLVILLHGGGMNVESFLGLDGKKAPSKLWLDIADEEKLYLAIPQGYQDHWNDCRGDCQHCGDEDDVGFINAMIDEIQTRYPVDNQRIYVAGVSNGGLMSYRLAVELSDRIAAIAAIIAALPAQNLCSEPVNPIPVLIMNGTADKLMPWEGGQSSHEGTGTLLSAYESVVFWVKHNNCDTIPEYFDFPDLAIEDGSTVSREIYDNGIQDAEVVLYRVDGGGHLEPSIAEQYSPLAEIVLGRQNHDIEMAREVWDFLKRHMLSGTTSVKSSADDLPVKTFQLSQNYPNPFNPSTVISYQLSTDSDLELSIYNALGQKVRTLVSGRQAAGNYQVRWDGKEGAGLVVSAGVYIYTLRTGDRVLKKKMVFLK